MYIDKIEDIPSDVMVVLKKVFAEYFQEEEGEGEEMTIEEVVECLRESYDDYDETTGSCYITCTYHTTIDGFRFEVDGSSYRKDQSVCDEEMGDGFSVVSLDEEKKKKEKAKNAKRAKSDENWREFFVKIDGYITPEKAFELLKDYKFPTKWKQTA